MRARVAVLGPAWLLCASLLGAQSWDIGWYDVADSAGIQTEMSANAARGLIPIALEIGPTPGAEGKSLYVMYARNGLGKDQWALTSYRDMDTLQDDVSRHIAAGWMPREVASSASRVFVLFHGISAPIEGWHFVNTYPGTMNQDVKDHADQGFFPQGCTVIEEDLWMLFVKVKGFTARSWQMKSFGSIAELRSGVNALLTEAFTPTGLLYDGKAMVVLFLG